MTKSCYIFVYKFIYGVCYFIDSQHNMIYGAKLPRILSLNIHYIFNHSFRINRLSYKNGIFTFYINKFICNFRLIFKQH